MAGAVNPGDESYTHFNAGVDTRNTPMTTVDRQILDFALKIAGQPVTKTHGQILNHFGMYPPEFWNRAQRLANHPDLAPREREKLSYIFPDPARPGPMSGGAPISDPKDFSHGLMW